MMSIKERTLDSPPEYFHGTPHPDVLCTDPNKATVKFAGMYLSLPGLAIHSRVQVCSLSRIFGGYRSPSMPTAKRIAAALGMSLDEFSMAYDSHRAALR